MNPPGLELLFNVEKSNISSREDCIVVAIHSFLLQEDFYCVGIGDEWQESTSETYSEMLPKKWNRDQNVYSFRYKKRGSTANILSKITKVNDLLLIDMVLNENLVASMPIPFEKHVSRKYNEYSTTYKEIESFFESFKREVMEKIQTAIKSLQTYPKINNKRIVQNPAIPTPPTSPRPNLERYKDPGQNTFAHIGNQDLDPLGRGTGGMVMNPSSRSSSGISKRSTLPEFGTRNPSDLPRGTVKPGSEFDPIWSPIDPREPNPDPDHAKPPNDMS